MNQKFVTISDDVYSNLEKIAEEKGFESIEKLLTAFANGFSTWCSVTVLNNNTYAA